MSPTLAILGRIYQQHFFSYNWSAFRAVVGLNSITNAVLSLGLCFWCVFQDYEYSCYNPLAYDIANLFCEMTADYHTETPHVMQWETYPGEVAR